MSSAICIGVKALSGEEHFRLLPSGYAAWSCASVGFQTNKGKNWEDFIASERLDAPQFIDGNLALFDCTRRSGLNKSSYQHEYAISARWNSANIREVFGACYNHLCHESATFRSQRLSDDILITRVLKYDVTTLSHEGAKDYFQRIFINNGFQFDEASEMFNLEGPGTLEGLTEVEFKSEFVVTPTKWTVSVIDEETHPDCSTTFAEYLANNGWKARLQS